jgi:hypothetical protein
MINPDTFKQIKQASLEDRIQLIELILQSLKLDLKQNLTTEKPTYKRFKVRKLSLGEEVQVDRDELYSERGL